MRYNIFLLLDVGTFSALVELLNMEIEYVLHQFSSHAEAIPNGLFLYFFLKDVSLENIQK